MKKLEQKRLRPSKAIYKKNLQQKNKQEKIMN